MVKHIVFWNLADEADGRSKLDNAALIKSKLEALNGVIPGMRMLEVGTNAVHGPNSMDLALYSEFESMEALSAYQIHPAHEEVKKFVAVVRTESRSVDFEN